MKRTVSVFLAMLLLFCLAGCETTAELKDRLNARITRGTIKENVYKSEFTGITFTKPDHWRYLTDEELAKAMSIGIEALDANTFEKSAMEYSNILDMMVINDATGLNVTIGYENLSLTNGNSISEEEYLSAMTEYLKTMGDTITGEAETITLSSENYLKATFTVVIDGVEMETTYYLRLIGDIMAVITVASPKNIVDRNIESMFS